MTEEKKGMLAAGTAYCIFGLSYLFSKMALEITQPFILLFIRFSVTVVILNLLAATKILPLNLKGKPIGKAILVGIVQPVLYFALENYGLSYTTTSFAGIVASVSPIFSAVLGVIFLREKPNGKQWICIMLSIIGVMLVSLGNTAGENTLLGCLCLLGAYLAGGLYSIMIRRLSKIFSAFELTYVMFMVGFAFFGVLAFGTYGGQTVAMMGSALKHWKFVVSCLYLGGVASVGAYLLANYSLAKLSVTRATVFGSISTLVSVLSGVFIMKDPFTLTSAFAFVMILVGVWGVNRFAAQNK